MTGVLGESGDVGAAQAVQASLSSLAAKEPDLRQPLHPRARWARSFATAAYRLALGREPDTAGLDHHADLLDADPASRGKVLQTLASNPSAHRLAPMPEVSLGRHTPGQVLAALHRLEQTGQRRDLYVAEVLTAVESLRASLPDEVDAALARSALVRGQHAADLAVAHLSSARSFTAPGPGGVSVVDVSGLLVAVPGEAWALGARLALRGDPHGGLTEHAVVLLAQASDPLVVVDVGSEADGGLFALRCAHAGHRVHVVVADERDRALLTASFALNGLEPAGVHADPGSVPEPVDAARLHGEDAAALAALDLGPDARAWTTGAAPQLDGWAGRGVPGVPGSWELTPLVGPA